MEQSTDKHSKKARIRAEVPTLKAAFTARQSAADFTSLVDGTNDIYGAGLITTPQSGFYKEAWLASRFGNYRGATHIWLGDDPPDFHILLDGRAYSFEATEVIRPGRRRDVEMYAVLEDGPVADPECDWLTIDENLKLLVDAVARKEAKGYEGIDGLLVYLNTGWIRSPLKLSEAIEDLLTQAAKLSLNVSSFAEVWVSCSTKVHRIF